MPERAKTSPFEAQPLSTQQTIIERVKAKFKPPQITKVMQGILDIEDFVGISGTLRQLDSNLKLTLEEKIVLLRLSVWQDDPDLKGPVAQKLKIDARIRNSDIDIVGNDPYLENLFSKLTDPEETVMDIPERPEPKIPQNQITPTQIIDELGLKENTARHYRGFYVRVGQATRLISGHKMPSPEIIEVDLFVAKTLKAAAEAGEKISNETLEKMASEKFKRKITTNRIRNSVAAVYATQEDIPKRRSRKLKQTWSTAKEKGEETFARIKTALSKGPVNIPELAKSLSLSTDYVRSKIKKIMESKKQEV
ncbi:MAG: hypothetical protein Q7R51_02670 [bacterium]|nr:hypothetical protein [bacterium]